MGLRGVEQALQAGGGLLLQLLEGKRRRDFAGQTVDGRQGFTDEPGANHIVSRGFVLVAHHYRKRRERSQTQPVAGALFFDFADQPGQRCGVRCIRKCEPGLTQQL